MYKKELTNKPVSLSFYGLDALNLSKLNLALTRAKETTS